MYWRTFLYRGKSYDHSHLYPHTITYVRPAEGSDPPRPYTVKISYSMHCFTRECKTGETPDPALLYSDDRETRVFDFNRWELSRHLPGIIKGLMGRKCFHTGYRNFFTVELINEADKAIVKYEIFFEVSRSTQKGILNLFVQSAYVRDTPEAGKRRHNPPIRFAFILHNTLNNIAIRIPK